MDSTINNICVNLIKNKENSKFKYFIQKYINENYDNILYDTAIANNNSEALTLLLNYDMDKWKGVSKITNSKYFNKYTLNWLLKNKFRVSTRFINNIIINKGNLGKIDVDYFKIIFKYINFNNNIILKLLLNNYKNKIPLSKSELNKIVNREKNKMDIIVNGRDDDVAPLNTAFIFGNESKVEKIVKYLVEHGANVNKKTIDNTPLINACNKGNESMVKYLVEHGADVNFGTRYKTPLNSACKKGHESIVKYLIEQGADVNKKINNETPLIIAYEKGYKSIMKYLIEHGANINIPKDYGTSLYCTENMNNNSLQLY